MASKTYRQQDVTLTLGGLNITGFIKGSAITISYDENRVTYTQGMHGQSVRSDQENDIGTCTISLLQGTDGNDTCQSLYDDGNRFALALNDPNGIPEAEADDCGFQKLPDMTFDMDPTQQDWVIVMSGLKMTHGRNYSPDDRG